MRSSPVSRRSRRTAPAAALLLMPLLALAPSAPCHEPAVGHADATAVADGDDSVWPVLTDYYWVRPMPSPGAPRAMGNAELRFGESVRALVDTEIELAGFMVPLEADETQATFLLVKQPVDPTIGTDKQGPEAIVRVATAEPVPRTSERIVVRGRLEVLHGDPLGVLYRLREAVLVE